MDVNYLSKNRKGEIIETFAEVEVKFRILVPLNGAKTAKEANDLILADSDNWDAVEIRRENFDAEAPNESEEEQKMYDRFNWSRGYMKPVEDSFKSRVVRLVREPIE